MTRRRFAFWLGLALFTLAEQLRVSGFDDLAAAIIRRTKGDKEEASPVVREYWSVASNKTWWWYERENWIDGKWELTGITTPVHKKTGEPSAGRLDYLDESLVPEDVRVRGTKIKSLELPEVVQVASEEELVESVLEPGQADPARRARHGRPPSKWLRSLQAEELRIWLKTIDVPEAGVSGMTFWTHLTEDHSFEAENIEGLTIDEQAMLHAAAHYGY